MKKIFGLSVLFLIFFSTLASAGDIRAGNLRVEQLSANTVKVTVNLYAQIHATAPQMQLCWGDGDCENWSSSQIQEWPEIDTKHFQMSTFHEYKQNGMVNIKVETCCWTGDVINLSSSEINPFKLQTTFLLGDEQDNFLNTTPKVDSYYSICTTQSCSHAPQAMDLENDELSWALCAPDLSVYSALDKVNPNISNPINFNTDTGYLGWINPPYEGLYTHVTCLTEKRDGMVISESQYFTLLVVNNSLNLQEPEALADFLVAPNPAIDFLHLKNIPPNWQNGHLQVFNAWGQVVLTQTGIAPVDLTQWTNGFYYLSLEKEGQRAIRRFVKGGQ